MTSDPYTAKNGCCWTKLPTESPALLSRAAMEFTGINCISESTMLPINNTTLVIDNNGRLSFPLINASSDSTPSVRIPPLENVLALPGFINAIVHVPSVESLFASEPELHLHYDPLELDMIAALESVARNLVMSGFTTIVVLLDHELLANYDGYGLAKDSQLGNVITIMVNCAENTGEYRPYLPSTLAFSPLRPDIYIHKSGAQWMVSSLKGEQSFSIDVAVNAATPKLLASSGDLVGTGNVISGLPNILVPLGQIIRDSPPTTSAVSLLQKITTVAAKALLSSDYGEIKHGAAADIVLVRTRPYWKDALSSLFMAAQQGLEIAAVFKNGHLIHADDAFLQTYKSARLSFYYRHESIPASVDVNSSSTISSGDQGFDSIESALEAYRRGEFLVVVDNEDRENEGDLIIAAEDFTPEKAAFMIRYTSGLICAPASGDILDRLELPLMVANNTESLKTAYTVSTDVISGTTTGISAADRSLTIRRMANLNSIPSEFSRPGHVFPLRAVPGGVLKRVGHTEAAVDLCRLAQKQPVAAICEIVLDDGRMARRDDLRVFASRFSLKMITIATLKLVERALELATRDHNRPIIIGGDWNAPHATLQRKVSSWGFGLHVVSFSGSKATFRGRTATARWSSIDHFVCNQAARALLTSPRVNRQPYISDHWPIYASLLAVPPTPPDVFIPTFNPDRCKELAPTISLCNQFSILANLPDDCDSDTVTNRLLDVTNPNTAFSLLSNLPLIDTPVPVQHRRLYRATTKKTICKAKNAYRAWLASRNSILSSQETIQGKYNQYMLAEATASRLTKQDDRLRWRSHCTRIDNLLADGCAKQAWNAAKRMACASGHSCRSSNPIRNEEGVLQFQPISICNTLRSHYMRLAEAGEGHSLDPTHWETMPQPPQHIPSSSTLSMDLPFSVRELDHALSSMHPRKAPGDDGITTTLMQAIAHDPKDHGTGDVNLDRPGALALLRVANTIFSSGVIPKVWMCATIISIPKKRGDATLASNLRGISLINVGLKILCKMVQARLSGLLESNNVLVPEQGGFRTL
ncbi:hypothetical protein BASA50_000263 [Batrachochytrium salamandrivorans]|uniref:3,4-dihydroxy-2-butanone-4-phosphate synthase n=1 Tax=Batrachochytrium salamandrivorans TaxID=1357716 RepID=A0ABQ8EUM3_9FUNG|nr:hypothetical protein BASA50_000263 [Batrachochytrium salamandrivorans]